MVVAKLNKGLQTQSKLMKVSKKLFYDNGYSKTSIKEICQNANESTGTFAYYFKTKDNLVSQIYAELLMKCYSFIGKKINRKINSVEKNTIAALLYYRAIFADKNTISFHQEINTRESIFEYIGHHLTRVHKQFVVDLNLSLDETELEDIIKAEYGLRREIILDFIEKPKNRSITDIVNIVHIFRARLMQIDENLMRAYLFNANEFVNKFDCSEVRFLG